MLVNGIRKNLEKVFVIAKNPEHFILEKYYGLQVPRGFRIELYAARQLELIYGNTKQIGLKFLKTEDCWFGSKKAIKHPKKLFCPYCEKLVIPKKLHKLDPADFVIFLFTAGFWAIFLFVIYLFVRRCPSCNYNLRGFKPISEIKKP